MAQFEIELENGHKYQIDADTEEQAVMAAKGEDGGTTTAVGAFTRSAATGVVPAFGALGGAAIGQAVIPIPVVGALVGGLAGSVGANVLQRQALKIAAPETAQRLAELEQADVQQHPYASFAGRFVSPSPAFQIAPKAAIQGLRAIPAALRAGASEEVKKLATQGATQAGLAVGTSAVIPMMPESLGGAGRLPTLGEVAEGTAQMMFYGKGRRIRAPRLPLSELEAQVRIQPSPPPEAEATPTKIEIPKGVEDAIQERSTAPVPLEPAPGDSAALVQGVPPPGETAQAQAEAPAPAPEVKPAVRVETPNAPEAAPTAETAEPAPANPTFAERAIPQLESKIQELHGLLINSDAFGNSEFYDRSFPIPREGGIISAKNTQRYQADPVYAAKVDRAIKDITDLMVVANRQRLSLMDKPGTGAFGVDYSVGKARAGYTVNVVRAWHNEAKQKYPYTSRLGNISIREAFQNSLDAVIAALQNKEIKQGAIKIDAAAYSNKGFKVDDNGIGMSDADIGQKFLSLHSTGKAVEGRFGGFGIAKAVILGPADSGTWTLHTRDNRFTHELAQANEVVETAPRRQGTEIEVKTDDYIIDDDAKRYVETTELPKNVTVEYDGNPVKNPFKGLRPSKETVQLNEQTSYELSYYPNSPEGYNQKYLIRLVDEKTGAKLTQAIKDAGSDGFKGTVIVDITTKAVPGTESYPLVDSRMEMKWGAEKPVNKLIEKHTVDPLSAKRAGQEAEFHNTSNRTEWSETISKVDSDPSYKKLSDAIHSIWEATGKFFGTTPLRPFTPIGELRIKIDKGYKGYRGGTVFQAKHLAAYEAVSRMMAHDAGAQVTDFYGLLSKPVDGGSVNAEHAAGGVMGLNFINLDKTALKNPYSYALYLRDLIAHELTHDFYGPHNEEFSSKEIAIQKQTAHLFPHILKISEAVLGKEIPKEIVERTVEKTVKVPVEVKVEVPVEKKVFLDRYITPEQQQFIYDTYDQLPAGKAKDDLYYPRPATPGQLEFGPSGTGQRPAGFGGPPENIRTGGIPQQPSPPSPTVAQPGSMGPGGISPRQAEVKPTTEPLGPTQGAGPGTPSASQGPDPQVVGLNTGNPTFNRMVVRTQNFFKGVKQLFQRGSQRQDLSMLANAADNLPNLTADQAKRSITLRLPDIASQRAVTLLIQSLKMTGPSNPQRAQFGGNPVNYLRQKQMDMETAAQEFLNRGGAMNKLQSQAAKELAQAYQFAADNYPRLRPMADLVKSRLDRQQAREVAAGVNVDYEQWYVPQRWELDLVKSDGPIILGGSGQAGASGFTKAKVFPDYASAIEYAIAHPGEFFLPRSLSIADLMAHRVRTGEKILYRNALFEQLKGINDPVNQKPIATAVPRRQIPRPDGTIDTQEHIPLDYMRMEIMPGKPIAIHKGYAKLISALTGRSQIAESAPVQTLSTIAAIEKHIGLALDTFHASRILQGGLALGRKLYTGQTLKKALALVEYAPEDLAEAVRRGEITQEMSDYVTRPVAWNINGRDLNVSRRAIVQLGIQNGLNNARIADAIYKDWLREMPVLGTVNKWIFDKLSRGVISDVFQLEFDRVSRSRPDLKAKEVAKEVARNVNAFFGNLQKQSIVKNPSTRSILNILFLAPQWVESLATRELMSVKQLGGYALAKAMGKPAHLGTSALGIGTGIAAYAFMTQVLNMFTRGHPTWQNEEEGHKFDAWIPNVADWVKTGKLDKTKGFFISPLSVFGEVTHDFLRYYHSKNTAHDAALQVVHNKLGNLGRMTYVLGTGRDPVSDQKLPSTLSRAMTAGVQVVPMPITASTPFKEAMARVAPGTVPAAPAGAIQRQLTASMGFKTEPVQSAAGQIHNLARNWMARTTDPKLRHKLEQMQQYDLPSAFRDLRTALRNDDQAMALAEYRKLLDYHKADAIAQSFRTQKPFTGSYATEAKFRATLTPEQKALYQRAQQERRELNQKFLKLRREYLTSIQAGGR